MMCENGNGRRGAGNTADGLTHPSGTSGEGAVVSVSPDTSSTGLGMTGPTVDVDELARLELPRRHEMHALSPGVMAAVEALPALLDFIRRQDAALTAVRELADGADARRDRRVWLGVPETKPPAELQVSALRTALALASPETGQEA